MGHRRWNYDFGDARTMRHLLQKAAGSVELTQERGFVFQMPQNSQVWDTQDCCILNNATKSP